MRNIDVINEIKGILLEAQRPALFCSFGKDSLLLLYLAQAAGFKGPIYYFADDLSFLAEEIIIERNLTVYSWPPADRYIVPNGNELAQVDEYLIGHTLLPTVSPIVHGDKCAHGEFKRFTKPFKYPHDVTLIGYKKDETCEAVGMTFPKVNDIGVTKLVSPLYDWTDEQVIEACDLLGIKYEDSNTVEYCDECLNAIISSDWDRDAALMGFRSRFNFINH